jgi:aerobic carbon-monoxide dehydrogenase medium subunit
MYPRAFHYHRASSLQQAVGLLSELGEEAKLLAGGQSLIPLMKLRFANPLHLVDLNFIPRTSYIAEENGSLRFGALTRHREIENSEIVAKVPILRDCAAGIGDVQVRNRGTIGGSLAEADPSGDWAVALLTLAAEVHCLGTGGERSLPLSEFVKDAYTTLLERDELIQEIIVKIPPRGSGGAYLSCKRAAPVYPTATAAVELTLDREVCQEITIALGCVGLTPIRAKDAETVVRGRKISGKTLAAAQEAAQAAADPQSDMRGSAQYKRALVGALVRRAIEVAVRRARGDNIEVSPIYA